MTALLQELVRLIDKKTSKNYPALLSVGVEFLAQQKMTQMEDKDEKTSSIGRTAQQFFKHSEWALSVELAQER